MSAMIAPATILFATRTAEPIVSFRQRYMIDGEPFVFVSERWYTEQAPAGVPCVPSQTPGQVLTSHMIRPRTGEVMTPCAVWIETATE